MESVFVALIGSLSTLAAVFISLRWGGKQAVAAQERDYRRGQMRDVFTAIINNSVELRHAMRAFNFSQEPDKGRNLADAMVKYNDDHYRLYALALLTSPAVSEALIDLYEADTLAARAVANGREKTEANKLDSNAEVLLAHLTRLMRSELELPNITVAEVDHLLSKYMPTKPLPSAPWTSPPTSPSSSLP